MTTIAELIRHESKNLRDSATPRLDTELLLAHCLDVDRATLFREPERALSGRQIERMRDLLRQRCAGKPISQLTGKAEFYSLQLEVNQNVLIPRADTETLVDKAFGFIDQKPITIVDVGTGSGAIAIAIATQYPNSTVIALDISPEALAVARRNVLRHELNNVIVQASDWLEAINDDSADMIVSNPPYVASEDPHFSTGGIGYEPRLALDGGNDGLDAYRQIIPQAHAKLSAGGVLLLEHGFDQAELVGKLLQKSGFRDVASERDIAGRERISFGQK